MFAPRTLGYLLAGVLLAGCAGTAIHQVADPVFTGHSGECRTRLRGLDRAFQTYLTDYDDQTPLANWVETLEPYFFGHPEFISCPGLASADLSESGYAFNQALVGQTWTSFPNHSQLVTFFETAVLTPGVSGDPNAPLTTSRHAGSIFRVYADGYLENLGD